MPAGTQGVILEFGANDALRGIHPKVTRAALEHILKRLKARHIAVLLCGMVALLNYGAEYAAQFNAIFPDLAKKYDVPLYPSSSTSRGERKAQSERRYAPDRRGRGNYRRTYPARG